MFSTSRIISRINYNFLRKSHYSTKTVAEQAKGRFTPLIQKLSAVQQPIMYWANVSKELVQQVYHSQKIAPPSNTHSPFLFWKSQSSEAWGRNFFIAVEIVGIFCAGQMVGRRKITPYH
ncbi:F1-FO ATP synthase subunit G [Schizosaccharomyces pombe]|uniref:ATP synthase subunit g, mitochondrial n=1 Tax=Schizosaccharomyces pombe (strain 972 / ATCC 24843) TaxID=284812 RepID=ATPN_SCHPO|nr:putative F0-ATPase subunit G [Schizosaccharomyces pombe]Q09774.1 RecName: Full=ATP synthase subunit g, mitochondrial; Short=ATPase subunit g [Schizosaccharomyces pombe 972h-]CAA91072.1 F0-ATPase subunit G (predicted) [Schizosaccharomyces pombe]|eukprot:NP_593034.1 putative F0-ATPase subunit G [Schizosaccharomyces pombe]